MSEITPNTPNPVREDAYKQQLAAKLGIDPQYIPGSPIWHSEEEIAAIAEMFSNMAGGGSGGGVLVVHYEDGALDKTWQEIHDAVASGQFIVIQEENDDGIFWSYISSVESGPSYYSVSVFWPGPASTSALGTDSPTGYPAG